MGKVVWTERASRHLNEIFDYIAKNSKVYAERLVKSVIAATSILEQMPFSGRSVPELTPLDFRELVHGNYRIVYHVLEITSDVEILAVIHGARDFKKVFDNPD
jgi:toxin ParE1/3/4